jgi:hypothetical protein
MVSLFVALCLLNTPADPDAQAESELAAARQQFIDARRSKKGFEQACLRYGEVAVNSPILPPQEKYPLALALFRQVLAMNPQNESAKQWEKTIVDIYAGLGKPPGDYDLGSIR